MSAIFDNLKDDLECGICCELMHDPVQLSPCQHLNCAGCLSDWFKKQYDCPNCRAKTTSVTRSRQHRNLVEQVLQFRPECKRDPLIVAELNATNIFNTDKFIVPQKLEVL